MLKRKLAHIILYKKTWNKNGPSIITSIFNQFLSILKFTEQKSIEKKQIPKTWLSANASLDHEEKEWLTEATPNKTYVPGPRKLAHHRWPVRITNPKVGFNPNSLCIPT